jgi:hypothetical protein
MNKALLTVVLLVTLYTEGSAQRCGQLFVNGNVCRERNISWRSRCRACGSQVIRCPGRGRYRCSFRTVTRSPTTTVRAPTTTTTTKVPTTTTKIPTTTTTSTVPTTTTTSTTSTSTTTTVALAAHTCPNRGPLPSPCPYVVDSTMGTNGCYSGEVNSQGCRVEADGNIEVVSGEDCPCSRSIRCRCGLSKPSGYQTITTTRGFCAWGDERSRAFSACMFGSAEYCSAVGGESVIDTSKLGTEIARCCASAGGLLESGFIGSVCVA